MITFFFFGLVDVVEKLACSFFERTLRLEVIPLELADVVPSSLDDGFCFSKPVTLTPLVKLTSSSPSVV